MSKANNACALQFKGRLDKLCLNAMSALQFDILLCLLAWEGIVQRIPPVGKVVKYCDIGKRKEWNGEDKMPKT